MEGLSELSSRTLWIIAASSGVPALALLIKLQLIDRQLKPHGIVGYEFAGSAERAKRMFSDWGEAGRKAARMSLRYDVPFLLVYPFLLSSLTVLASRGASEALVMLGSWLAVAPFVAAGLDALEDLALWLALDRFQQPPESLLRVAALAAGTKFLLLGASTLYAAGLGLRHLAG